MCKMTPTLNALLIAAFITCLLGADGAMATTAKRTAAMAARRAHDVYLRHHPRRWTRYGFAPVYNTVPPGAIVMPGYVYMPGRGILDESCNLPTSACPNSERDIQ